MRFRDALKFSLELILPEKAVLAVERLAVERPRPERSAEPAPVWEEPAAPRIVETDTSHDARRIIEELDSRQFGGPSFGPQSISLMALALAQAQASSLMTDERIRAIAAAILKVAESGERDPDRLRTRAMSALEQEEAQAAEVPVETLPDPPQAVSGPDPGVAADDEAEPIAIVHRTIDTQP